jgi:formylglycine-generating enzyme
MFLAHCEAVSACCGPQRGEAKSTPVMPGPSVRSNLGGADVPADAIAMSRIPPGSFPMGTDDPRGYSADGESPVHEVELDAFRMGVHTVTNDEFARFVEATGHRTTAEEFGSSFVFVGLLPDDFPLTRAVAAVPWWRDVGGADWRHPEGPHSDVGDRGRHPVVHVSWLDAAAFCTWAGCRLPSEAEWERAARGHEQSAHYPWGDEREPEGQHRMNVFQGDFPDRDSGADGWIGTCPVGSFAANDFGLYEMTGNVWEWCADWFAVDYYQRSVRVAPQGPWSGQARVMRGGSYLCHESYCWRYRVDARSSNTPDSSTGNLGFRVAAEA